MNGIDTMARNVLGKPTTVTRSGLWNGSTLTADRRYESYGSTVFMDLDHVYDKNGNLTGRLDSDGGVDETRSMIYDGLDRLTWADAPGVLGSAAYTYDPLDNLREIDFAGGARTPQTDIYRYDATNRLYEIFRSNTLNQTQTVPYGDDVRGNMILRGVGGHTHTYDRANRMLSANTGASIENYRYDGHGRRNTITRSGTIGTNTHFYTLDGKLVYERAPSGTVTRHIHLGNRLVATVTGGTVSQHTDTLGSIVRRTNLIRGTVGTTVYEPYGSLGVGTTYEQRPGFTGHTTDAATTLSYMQQRYYDSTAMRFLSVDPVQVSTTDGSNFNRYRYANNNPYKYVDPDGRESGCIYGGGCGGMPSAAQNEVFSDAMDIVPGIGDIKGIAEAFANPTVPNIAAAVVGLGGPIGDGVAKAIKGADKVADAARVEVKERASQGADGARSRIALEKDAGGNTLSRKHTVDKEGQVVHQHQEHMGKHGSQRSFPDEWTGTETINAEPKEK